MSPNQYNGLVGLNFGLGRSQVREEAAGIRPTVYLDLTGKYDQEYCNICLEEYVSWPVSCPLWHTVVSPFPGVPALPCSLPPQKNCYCLEERNFRANELFSLAEKTNVRE